MDMLGKYDANGPIETTLTSTTSTFYARNAVAGSYKYCQYFLKILLIKRGKEF